MTPSTLYLGSPDWMTGAVILVLIAAATLAWSYLRGSAGAPWTVRTWCAVLKGLAIGILALFLLEPLLGGNRARPGANAFVILADNSQSLQIGDGEGQPARGDWLRRQVADEPAWSTRLAQDFDVRRYLFDTQLRPVERFDALTFDGAGSSLATSLGAIARRFRGLPLAGILVFTDGIATDAPLLDTTGLPPVYPVSPGSKGIPRDIAVRRVSTSQTNFESAPVVITAEVAATGFDGRKVVVVLADESGAEIQRQDAEAPRDGKPLGFRFQFRPARKGVSFYSVSASVAGQEGSVMAQVPGKTAQEKQDATQGSSEQTLANNSRQVLIDQGAGPYRVLYLSGRPNWEFKFLRRAVEEDDQIQLVGLVRIARRQPKFDFRNPRDRAASELFKGFDHPDPETAEQYDQPVLIRLNTLDEAELRDGFPKTAEELYRYQAIVVDDLEAAFFTQDQLALLRSFVSQRGGGLLMLGGPDSFADGKYDRTPVGELLPVYLGRDRGETADEPEPDGPTEGSLAYRLELTREGWLQPWVRGRPTEDEERKRLSAMPPFQVLSRVGQAKPGAVVLAEVADASGKKAPALVAQQFGKGHVAANLIGDLWRSGMHREDPAASDLEKSWRQTVRWLVGDVPGRVDVSISPRPEVSASAVELAVKVRDPAFLPLDNAKVAFKIRIPGGKDLTLDAEADGKEAGRYAARYVARQPGPYRVVATATGPDGNAIGEREAGWVAQPASDEFARLEPDREFLRTIAARTGGEPVQAERLAAFAAGLPTRKAPVMEPWASPLWHHPASFLVAIACLLAEWGLRRLNGLA